MRETLLDPVAYIFHDYEASDGDNIAADRPCSALSALATLSPASRRVFETAKQVIRRSSSAPFTRMDLLPGGVDDCKRNRHHPPYNFPECIPAEVSWALFDLRTALRTVSRQRPAGEPAHPSEAAFLDALCDAPYALGEIDQLGQFSQLDRKEDANFVYRSAEELLDSRLASIALEGPVFLPTFARLWSTARSSRC